MGVLSRAQALDCGLGTTSLTRRVHDGRLHLPRALERAEELRLFDLAAIDAAMARAPGRRGLKPLTAALELHRPGIVTRSELERMALALLADAGCPRAATA
jgi:hypothetical protein